MFGDYNPYRQPLFGDWLAMPSRGEDPDKHPGMVFLNGRALYEVTSLEDTLRRGTVTMSRTMSRMSHVRSTIPR